MSTDQELFDAATSNEPRQETPVEVIESPAQQPAIARDDAGRFATNNDVPPPSGEEQAPVAGSDPKEPPPHRFREVSERARAAEARAAELEKLLFQQMNQRGQPEPVAPLAPQPKEIWDDPPGFVSGFIDPVKQELSESLFQTREFYSRKEAVREHGAEKVNEAVTTFQKLVQSDPTNGPGAMTAIKASLDPIGEILAWHDQYQERQDPDLARKRSIERLLADPAQREMVAQMLNAPAATTTPQAQPAGAPPANVVKLPPNLNRMTSASSDASGSNDVSDQELFHATTSRRR